MNSKTSWDKFFRDKVKQIFRENNYILDIGGGLRISKTNRVDQGRAWMLPLLKNKNYKVVDPVPDYNPDIVADIHHLPMADDSVEAIFCIAVLEHVEDPIRATQEMYRVLQKGGHILIYVPFLYYYHAEKGYYGDFWRFTEDSIKYMCRKFEKLEIMPARYALETWIHLSPFGRYSIFIKVFRFLDKIFKKTTTKQVAGYYVFLQK